MEVIELEYTNAERDSKNENEMRNVCEVDREMLCVTSYDTSILFISCHVSSMERVYV